MPPRDAAPFPRVQVSTTPLLSKASEPAREEESDDEQLSFGQTRVGEIISARVGASARAASRARLGSPRRRG
jgi:hypothetical protein